MNDSLHTGFDSRAGRPAPHRGGERVFGKRLKTVVFSLLPTVSILLAGEIVLRVINPGWMACVRTHACPHPDGAPRFVTEQKHNFTLETKEPLLVFDPELFWRPRANVAGTVWSTPGVRTDGLGFRQSGVDLSRNRTNILVVGDSVVWGSLVEEPARFTNVASALLARRPEFEGAQIVNAGVVGYSSHQVYHYLRTRGMRRFAPRVIVVCVGVNDSWLVPMSDSAERAANRRVSARLRRLLQRSDLFLFFQRYASEAMVWARTGANPRGLTFLYPGQSDGPLVARTTPMETVVNFRAIGRLADAHQAALIVLRQTTRVEHPNGWDGRGFAEARERIGMLVEANGWASIDFARLADPPWGMQPEEFLLDFCHLHPSGHAIVAQWLVEALRGVRPWSGMATSVANPGHVSRQSR